MTAGNARLHVDANIQQVKEATHIVSLRIRSPELAPCCGCASEMQPWPDDASLVDLVAEAVAFAVVVAFAAEIAEEIGVGATVGAVAADKV